MNIKIQETGEIRELRAVSRTRQSGGTYNGVEWTRDLIEDGGRPHDDDGNTIMSQEDYGWWHQYIADMDSDEAELEALTDELRGIGVDSAADEVRDTVTDHLYCADMEDHHRSRRNAIADIRARHGLSKMEAADVG